MILTTKPDQICDQIHACLNNLNQVEQAEYQRVCQRKNNLQQQNRTRTTITTTTTFTKTATTSK